MDVTIKMYKEFYRKELKNLLDQQESICEGVKSCKMRKHAGLRKRHWQNVPLTLGIEEEYQIVSRKTWELTPQVDKILKTNRSFGAHLGREVYQSQVEIKTDVCDDIPELRRKLVVSRSQLYDRLPHDLSVISAGSHPISKWTQEVLTPSPRAKMFMHDMQDVVRRLVTFGLHIHVGIEDKELAIQIMNSARSFLPLMLALSANSPFWGGRLTGLMSYRSTVFSSLPRTGIPPLLSDYHEYEDYVDLMHRTKSFDSAGSRDPRKIWWDIRVHPEYPTLEFRIFDACSTVDDAICMAAICQAIVAKLAKLAYDGIEYHVQKKHIIEENKWHAIRYGRKARFIEDQSKRVVGAHYKCHQLLDFVEDVIPSLGSANELQHMLRIARLGGGADRQIEIFQRRGDLVDVVKWLANQFNPHVLCSRSKRLN